MAMFYDIEVEWLDGKKEEFHVGGQCTPEVYTDDVLHLYVRDGEMAPITRVASIPLINVRKYVRKYVRK